MKEEIIIMHLKTYIPALAAVFATLFGAFAHALEDVRKNGWKGMFYFASDVFVCCFIGWLFFHAVSFVNPDYAVLGSSIGSYWGTKGFVKIRDLFFDTLAKLKP